MNPDGSGRSGEGRGPMDAPPEVLPSPDRPGTTRTAKQQENWHMADTRIRHAKSEREAEAFRDEYITQGYSVQSEGEATTIVKKSYWGSLSGHILVLIFTVWWTLGLGNLVYALAVHKEDSVLIKVDGGEDA